MTNPAIHRHLDPDIVAGIPATEGPVDIGLRAAYGVEHVLLSTVHPLTLPVWAQTLLGGSRACAQTRRVSNRISGVTCTYEMSLAWESRDFDRIAALQQTGHVFVVLTRRKQGLVTAILFWTGAGPLRQAGRLIRAFVAGAFVGALALHLVRILCTRPY